MANTSKFVAIETRLNNAIAKVQARLAVLSSRTELSIEQQQQHPDHKHWNDLHDLEDRLNNRLWDNWSASKDAHWDAHGFNSYSF